MAKVEKIKLGVFVGVFGIFMLTIVGLTIYNSLTLGTTCTFCVR